MMNKKNILGIVIVLILISSSLLFTGCPLHIDSLYGVKVAGDGNGGAFAVYEDTLGGNIYAQKINPSGQTLWGEKGVLLGRGGGEAYSYFNLDIISDGSGGAIIAWPDFPEDNFRPSRHIARIGSDGNILWKHGFIYFRRLIGDGSGGAVIAFDNSAIINIDGDNSDNLALVRIDSQGDYPWGIQGVSVPRQNYQDNTLRMTRIDSGEIILVWEEQEPIIDPMHGNIAGNLNYLFAQKIDSNGNLLWKDRIPVCTLPENAWIASIQITSNVNSGTIIGWFQITDIIDDTGENNPQLWDIKVQKIDADGKTVWQPDGVPMNIAASGGRPAPEDETLIVGDASGGAIIGWRDLRQDRAIYAQRIDATGNLLWQSGGIEVSSTSLNPRSQMISDDSSGSIIAYSFQEDGKKLHVQKVDVTGNPVWQENGISITEKEFSSKYISSDGTGGVIVGWGVGKGTFSSEKAYIQRVSTDGNLLWGEEGIRLNP